MLALKDNMADMEQLLATDKKIILYGAGASCELILQAYYEQGLKNKLSFIVDGNEELDGKECAGSGNIRVKIFSLSHFIREWKGRMEEFVMVMTPYHALAFIPQLDEIKELDGLTAYLFSMIVNKKMPGPFPFHSLDRPVIPKKIHYIWIGGNALPEEDRRNIESWRRFCPDYEICLWNEENYDFQKNRYVREAVANGQYMYATDYVRKDILYRCGGIYLDTDVELLAPIDDLLYNEAFIGIEDGGQLNSGSGLGAVAGHPLMKEMRDIYEDTSFIDENGRPNYHYNTYYETKFMLDRGFLLRNEYQNIDGMICFPREVLMPEGVIGLPDTYTERTLANHKINPYDKTERRKLLSRVIDGGSRI